MTKKDFIKLAIFIKWHNKTVGKSKFTKSQISTLADFCAETNLKFNRQRWLDFIAGKVGLNGRKLGENQSQVD